METMRNAEEGLGVIAITETGQNELDRIQIFRPFAVYLIWKDGQKKLVCLCPDTDMPDLVAQALSIYYTLPIEKRNTLPIEDRNNH
jgi:hypothetical protein